MAFKEKKLLKKLRKNEKKSIAKSDKMDKELVKHVMGNGKKKK